MTTATRSKFTRQLVGQLDKPEGAWRLDAEIASTFMVDMNQRYPYADWEGDSHTGYKVYALVRA